MKRFDNNFNREDSERFSFKKHILLYYLSLYSRSVSFTYCGAITMTQSSLFSNESKVNGKRIIYL